MEHLPNVCAKSIYDIALFRRDSEDAKGLFSNAASPKVRASVLHSGRILLGFLSHQFG